MPRRSPQVRSEPFGDGLALHDEARAEVHVLNQTGALVWDACDGTTSIDAVVELLSARLAQPVSSVGPGVRAHLDALRSAGLVDRGIVVPPVRSPTSQPVGGACCTPVLLVLDQQLVIRSNDPGAIDRLRTLFAGLEAPGATPDAATVELGFHVEDGGSIRVVGRGHDQRLAPGAAADEAITSLVNRITASAGAPLALHAGAVRSPQGRVVLLPGRSGAGKSTLTGALVQAGWDYLTDEAAGVRVGSLAAVGYPKPLSLDEPSRRVLGIAATDLGTVPVDHVRRGAASVLGDGGTVAAIVLPTYRPDADLARERLGPDDALAALAGHAINLTPSGQVGLRTLVQLAERVPCWTMEHGGARPITDAVEELARRLR